MDPRTEPEDEEQLALELRSDLEEVQASRPAEGEADAPLKPVDGERGEPEP